MKLNEKSLAFYATCDSPADHAGFLHKKGERNTAYHRRWFVLKGNLLFYFEDREGRDPVGVIILEGCTVELSVFFTDGKCPKASTSTRVKPLHFSPLSLKEIGFRWRRSKTECACIPLFVFRS
uniref:PH domain containing endocytic trafficking adaptor 1 n=1 Tax=Salvator merianae TaxID=96440 RepID=A0A8D0BV83_SALMN